MDDGVAVSQLVGGVLRCAACLDVCGADGNNREVLDGVVLWHDDAPVCHDLAGKQRRYPYRDDGLMARGDREISANMGEVAIPAREAVTVMARLLWRLGRAPGVYHLFL